jgi:5-deoxy-D-glucuronate isomerase
VGFQSPADHTVVPFEPARGRAAPALLVAPLRPAVPSEFVPSRWSSVFPERRTWRHLDAEWVALRSGERLTVGSSGWECAIVVVSGEIALPASPPRRLPAFGLVRLAADASLELRAVASPTVLIAVKGAVRP